MSSATDSDATGVFLAGGGLALAEHERTDAVRIAEREHAVAEQQRDDRRSRRRSAHARRRPP
jgi:hypothetical protein